jgi:hypothetical protein
MAWAWLQADRLRTKLDIAADQTHNSVRFTFGVIQAFPTIEMDVRATSNRRESIDGEQPNLCLLAWSLASQREILEPTGKTDTILP